MSDMTPEQAQELLDMANRGETDGQRPVTVAAKYAPLAEAAYALAQTVAGLHYEYAVQIKDREPASWWKDLAIARGEMEEIRKAWPERVHNFRIVRRLVGEPEAVE